MTAGSWFLPPRRPSPRPSATGRDRITAVDGLLAAAYEEAVRIAGRRGAKVVLFTSPGFDTLGEEADGAPLPDNEPVRADEVNGILRTMAAHNRIVTVIDPHRILDPQNRFTTTVGGVDVRDPDGVHVTPAGDGWLQPRVLPTAAVAGRSARPRRTP